jgi:hypothetical protein
MAKQVLAFVTAKLAFDQQSQVLHGGMGSGLRCIGWL